jgi:hypothetical protein
MIEKEQIMNDLIISESKTKTTKSLCPAGTHNAVCTGVDDLGLQSGFKNANPVRKIVFRFDVEELIDDGPLTGKPHRSHIIVNALLCENSTLKKILTEWGGYSGGGSGNHGGYRIKDLVGKPAIIVVCHQPRKNGETAPVINGIFKHIRSLKVLEPSPTSLEPPEWVKKMQAKRLDNSCCASKAIKSQL